MPSHVTIQLAKADEVNGNGRRYPKAVLERVVKCARPGALIPVGLASTSARLDTMAGLVKSLSMDGDVLQCEIELLDTEAGKIANALVDGGYRMFSMSGVGTVDHQEDGVNVVQDDYMLDGIVVDMRAVMACQRLREVLRNKLKLTYDSKRPAENHQRHPGQL